MAQNRVVRKRIGSRLGVKLLECMLNAADRSVGHTD